MFRLYNPIRHTRTNENDDRTTPLDSFYSSTKLLLLLLLLQVCTTARDTAPIVSVTIDGHEYNMGPDEYCTPALGGPCVSGPMFPQQTWFVLGDVFHRKFYTVYDFGDSPKVLVSRENTVKAPPGHHGGDHHGPGGKPPAPGQEHHDDDHSPASPQDPLGSVEDSSGNVEPWVIVTASCGGALLLILLLVAVGVACGCCCGNKKRRGAGGPPRTTRVTVEHIHHHVQGPPPMMQGAGAPGGAPQYHVQGGGPPMQGAVAVGGAAPQYQQYGYVTRTA